MTDNVCLSGGCDGADLAWGAAAEAAGHGVLHYGFWNMHSKADLYKVLNMVQLEQADEHLERANRTLQRKYPTQSTYVNNLLRRNWWQVKESQRVYAVAPIKDNQVQGGTGWAVQMAIDKGIMEIYCWDMNKQYWAQWLHGHNSWGFDYDDIPKPHGIYTGIGSREITEAGLQAIKDVYTF